MEPSEVAGLIGGLHPIAQVAVIVVAGAWLADKVWYHHNRIKKNGAPLRVEAVNIGKLEEAVDRLEDESRLHYQKSDQSHESMIRSMDRIERKLE